MESIALTMDQFIILYIIYNIQLTIGLQHMSFSLSGKGQIDLASLARSSQAESHRLEWGSLEERLYRRERNEFNLHYDGAINLPLQVFLMQANEDKLPFGENKLSRSFAPQGAWQEAAAVPMDGFKDDNILGGVNAGFGCGVPLVHNNTKLLNPRWDSYPSEVRGPPLVYGGGTRYR
jgi:hypothetical protein